MARGRVGGEAAPLTIPATRHMAGRATKNRAVERRGCNVLHYICGRRSGCRATADELPEAAGHPFRCREQRALLDFGQRSAPLATPSVLGGTGLRMIFQHKAGHGRRILKRSHAQPGSLGDVHQSRQMSGFKLALPLQSSRSVKAAKLLSTHLYPPSFNSRIELYDGATSPHVKH